MENKETKDEKRRTVLVRVDFDPEVIRQIEEAIEGTDLSFDDYVNQTLRYFLEDIDEKKKGGFSRAIKIRLKTLLTCANFFFNWMLLF